ncbi:RagB/SusD family nutrient uptake outer membrane protein [Arenibacter palladensis]|uniref:RagB/SusD family nutrient uptake outer membrane protein n=1 Tax=Arenibacter palladensis TaxID=237373 RepID=UPI0026E40EF2|nr:RagB/SusD family nutrient uptake outer membrane protein [Arenibacter palladensis]MDO6603954.1 RagB/SusD family nutrient uptake outer membrane protein [Arenibacter palladensis]
MRILIFSTSYIKTILVFSLILVIYSCNDNFLDEQPLSSLNAELTLSSKEGFDNYLVGLVRQAREEYTGGAVWETNWIGTDIGDSPGEQFVAYKNWTSYLTPTNSTVISTWNWAFSKMISQANTIIYYASKTELEEIWSSDEEKNAVIAEARFFRGYTYNMLANLYGGVPIVDNVSSEIKFDYARATRQAVYEFAKADLEYASQWLPLTVDSNREGRIVKGAADHLLSEVNISLGFYDDAIASASEVIESGLYELMTTRFGNYLGESGDVYSDLFEDGNQNRSSGNMESIYVWQIEEITEGGAGTSGGNQAINKLAPFYTLISDPDGVANVASDSLGRGVGETRGTNYSIYDIWKNDSGDIRNSKNNFKRDFYYNNSKSQYFGQLIEPQTTKEDTLRNLYPYPRKIEGKPWQGSQTSGRTGKDVYVYRLAETFLLRAEAYFRKGDLSKAADDINAVRSRSNASTITPDMITLDYILDERARELMYETPRRRTLIRMGLLVERVSKYGILESSRTSIQDYHSLWPIPQEAIDANLGAELEQNPGY